MAEPYQRPKRIAVRVLPHLEYVKVSQHRIPLELHAGVRGPAGPQGQKGDTGADSTVEGPRGPMGSIDQVLTTIEPTSANTAVLLVDRDHIRASTDGEVIFGLTTQAGAANTQVLVKIVGELEDDGWSWTMGRTIVADVHGRLTQEVPELGVLRVVGEPLSPTRMLVQIRPNVQLAPVEPDELPQEHQLEADVAVSALTAVTLTESNRITPAFGEAPIFGITVQSGLAGVKLITRSGGEITDSAWSWRPYDPVFATPQATLTQVAPRSGVMRVVGHAISARALLVQIQPPVYLA